jgi:hypothetical protein
MDENKVLSFMNRIEQQRADAQAEQQFHQSLDYKYRVLDKEKERGKNLCIARIFEKFYRDSVPLKDSYKCAYGNELNCDMDNYAKSRGYDDLSYFVNEARNRGSKAAARILESVERIVDAYYEDVECDIVNIDNPDKFVFKMDDSTEEQLDAASKDMELDDLSNIISDNVKQTALSEISRAKAEKEKCKEVEAELANDLNIQSEAAIDRELALRGINDRTEIFQPSIFEGIMIGKMSHYSTLQESGMLTPTYLYDVMDDYGIVTESNDDIHYASPEELAFVEAVREYTCLSISKALKLESFDSLSKLREMAYDYAAG